MNTNLDVEKRHPIQVVAKRTGLTADVLRVWEKRYAVVEPGRSSGGHRLYSDVDVERLGLLESVPDLTPVPNAKFPQAAKRPLYSVLDTTAVSEAYGIEPASLQESSTWIVMPVGHDLSAAITTEPPGTSARNESMRPLIFWISISCPSMKTCPLLVIPMSMGIILNFSQML